MNCYNCGNIGSPDARFCQVCGSYLGQAAGQTQAGIQNDGGARESQSCDACNGSGLDAFMQSCQNCGGTGRAFMQPANTSQPQPNPWGNYGTYGNQPNQFGQYNQFGQTAFQANQFNQSPPPNPAAAKPYVITGIILGVIGIILCILNFWIPVVYIVGLGLGITATVLGTIVRRMGAKSGTAALALGIVGIVLGALFLTLGCVIVCTAML